MICIRSLRKSICTFCIYAGGVFLFSFIIGSVLYFPSVFAAPDQELTYHGKLSDALGISVPNGNYDFTISVYDASSGGTCLWTARGGSCATAIPKIVSVTNGVFFTTLGEAGDNPLNLAFDANYYLEVKIGTNAPMSPRRKITPTGFAMNAHRLNGKTADNYIDTSATAQTKAGALAVGGDLTVNTNNLFVNTTNGRVGIGTNSPGSKMDVRSNQTTGTVMSVGSATSTTLSGALTGQLIDLSTNYAFNTNSVTGSSILLAGMPSASSSSMTLIGQSISIGNNGRTVGGSSTIVGSSLALSDLTYSAATTGTSTESGFGVTATLIRTLASGQNIVFNGFSVVNPTVTQSGGSAVANGVSVTTSSITTNGTQNGVNIASSGVGAGSLNGVNIGSITAGAGAERAINIATGWDYGIYSATTGNSYFAGNVGIGDTTPAALFTVGTNDAFQVNASGQVIAGLWQGTAIDMAKGGTGLTSAGTSGNLLRSTGTGWESWTPPTYLTTVDISSHTNLAGGSGISLTDDTLSLGNLTANWSQTGAFDIILANAASELQIMESAGASYYGTFDVGDLAGNQTYTFTTGGTVYTSGNDPYNTVAEIVATPLTGYAVGTNDALATTDTIVGAFGKVQAQINARGLAIGNTVTSATVGSIFFSGASNTLEQDNTNFFWDNSEKRLGIGTATPSAMLSLFGVNNKLRFSYDAANYTDMYVNNGGGLVIEGSTTPTEQSIVIGAGAAQDISVKMDGFSEDYYAGLDYETGNYMIGTGSTVGSNAILTMMTTNITTAARITSTLPVGTSPFSVTSTTVNTNLNADLLDGQHSTYYRNASNINAGTLNVLRGGTGTSTQFAQGSVVFADISGVYNQDNTNFFWDNSTKRLGLGTNTPSAMLSLFGINNKMRFSYDAANYTDLYVDSAGQLTMNASSSTESVMVIGSGVAQDTSTQYDGYLNDFFAGIDDSTGLYSIGAGTSVASTATITGPGTVTNTAGGTTVTGTNTKFLSTFRIGNTITIGAQTVAISAIASDTSMTTAVITAANTNASYTYGGGTKFAVEPSGNVGIGKADPEFALDVLAAGTGTIARFSSTNNTVCSISGGGLIACSSDARLKRDVESIGLDANGISEANYGLETIKMLKPSAFRWNYDNDGSAKQLGFIAQEVENIVPELVITDAQTGYKQLNTIGFVPILTQAIKEQQGLIETNSNDLTTKAKAETVTQLQSLVDEQFTRTSTILRSVQEDILAVQRDANDAADIKLDLAVAQSNISVINTLLGIDPTDQSPEAKVAISTLATNMQKLLAINEDQLLYTTAEGDLQIGGVMTAQKFVAEEVETGKLTITSDDETTMGAAVICPEGKTFDQGDCVIAAENEKNSDGKSVTISSDAVNENSTVFTSFESDPGSSSWVEKDKNDAGDLVGFTIKLGNAVKDAVKIHWWIVDTQ